MDSKLGFDLGWFISNRAQGIFPCSLGHGIRQYFLRTIASQTSGKTSPAAVLLGDSVKVDGVTYPTDSLTNISPRVLSKVSKCTIINL